MHAVDGAKPHQIRNDDSALRLSAVHLSSLKSPQIDTLIYDWHSIAIIIAEVFTVVIFQGRSLRSQEGDSPSALDVAANSQNPGPLPGQPLLLVSSHFLHSTVIKCLH